MNIGIIVHSQTGNTLSVAKELKKVLLGAGHSVSIEKMIAVHDREQDFRKVKLIIIPQHSSFDALIFGAPVRGFSLSPVMKAYLSQIETLQGKKVECFVTEFFPFPWMGGNQAIRQMKEICESKGAEVIETGIVNWSSRSRNDKIDYLAKEQSTLF